MGREILITPNRNTTGSTLEPTISFSGATNGSINLKVEDDGSIVFEGTNGGLFNITDSKNGLLHSVNDVSGLPILSVYSDDRVIAGAYNQNALVVNSDKVGIGIPNPSEKLHVSGNTIVNGDYLMLSDTLTTIPALNFKGFVDIQNSDDNIGYFGYNLNSSGETGLFIYNESVAGGGIETFGSTHIRGGGPHVVGSDFYRNKILISANNSSDGMVIKPKADDPSATLWFEMDTASVMILKGDGSPGSGNAFLGVALNPDGTEMPTSNLQIGGTGTTGTFQYRDGNQQSGYVLTSDSDGNATWQVSTGGGTGSTTIVQFTGNTSASCITDLYVTNVHGCSPITFWDQLQHNGSTASGLFSTAFGQTTAIGNYSHAEGESTVASGTSSHAEGTSTVAGGDFSHAEGNFTTASGPNSHSQGIYTIASGNGSHAGGVGQNSVSKVRASELGAFNHSVVDSVYSGGGASNILTFILGGYNNSAAGEGCGVIGGTWNTVNSNAIPNPVNSVIVGGFNNVIHTGLGSVILGGNGLTGTSTYTVYVPDFVIKRAAAVPTTSTDTVGEKGSITYDDDFLYIKARTGRWGRIALDFGF